MSRRFPTLIFAVLILAALCAPSLAWPIAPAAAQGTCGTAPAPRLVAGQSARVIVTNGVGNNLRVQPGASATIAGVLADGELFTVLAGPQCVADSWWWQVRRVDGQTGWTAEGGAGQYWVEPWPVAGATLAPGPRPDLPTLRLAYAAGYDGYLVPHTMAANGAEVQARGTAPALDGRVVWSPDGTRLAFSDGADIWELGAFDAVQVTSTPGAAETWPTYAPDGTRIAFVQSAGNAEIMVYSMVGGMLSNLTNSPAQETSPAWSPDGAQIAFVSDRDGTPELYAIPASGGAAVRLTNSPGTESAPAWSPDGTQIAFLTTGGDGVTTLAVIRLGGAPLSLTPADDVLAFAWSPDGSRLAYTAETPIGSGMQAVLSVRADGQDRLQYTVSGAQTAGVTWSPGGQWIAFADNASGNFDLYAIRAGGFGLVRLTDNPGLDAHPVFQPPTTPDRPDEGSSALAPAAPVTAPGTEDLLLIYDAGTPVFTLQNVSGQPLNLTPLSFLGGSVAVPSSVWAEYTSSPLNSFKARGCLMLWAFNIPDQPSPPECGDARQGWVSNNSVIFWTQGTFDVLYNNAVVASCQTAAGRCTVNLP